MHDVILQVTVLPTTFPGSLSFSSLVVEERDFSTTREEKEREPGNEVAVLHDQGKT